MSQWFDQTTQPVHFTDAAEALGEIQKIYSANTGYLREKFRAFTKGERPDGRVSASYPYVAINVAKQTHVDPRLAYGFVPGPGRYQTSVTRPDMFSRYYLEQFSRLLANHGVTLEVGVSDEPIPVHFAYPAGGMVIEADLAPEHLRILRDYFDVPDLMNLDDSIVNGTFGIDEDGMPLAPFTAGRVDYSLHRLRHYTATEAEHFQNFVIFTNYQFYVEEFQRICTGLMESPDGHDYSAFIEPGGRTIQRGGAVSGNGPGRMPQMPAYHLQRPGHGGITLINIGIGPSNAKTITDHVAVLRPHAWIMLGHCAGLRSSQRLGDYVLAHAYVRDDHVLDADLPTWVPIPALAEVQLALAQAVADVTGLGGYDTKSIMRTGTVLSIDNRNWELRGYGELLERFSQSRAIALDMESAVIAANGYRFRVPYGTLLCVSDKPLHGELKLAGMADRFYRDRVDQHLKVGMRAMELLGKTPPEQLHSRKLRSFIETAFQ